MGNEQSVSLSNYAGVPNIDQAVADELTLAGIKIERLPEICRQDIGEVKTVVFGTLHGWTFRRAWRYWVCTGPGIPVDAATRLHHRHGRAVRVDGHCGCPSPLEWFHGLGVGHYHVDTLIGLKALVDTIREVIKAGKAAAKA